MSASAPPNAAVTPTVLKATPVHSSTTSASPVRHSATATQIRRRIVLLVDEPREERDEERRGELDEERDADRQVLDRHEVEPLHERDADEPERDEEEQLAPIRPAGATARPRGGRRGSRIAAQVFADLRELERREPRAEDDLGDAAVDGEERRSGRHHRVAEPSSCRRGAPRGAGWGRRPCARRLSTYTVARRGVAQPGRALALGARGRQFKSARPDSRRALIRRSPACAGLRR